MRIQINTDKQITADAKLQSSVEAEVTKALERFADQLTRVGIHLSDLNSSKPGLRDKRCMLEVRPAGKKPVSTSSDGDTVAQAVKDAAGKMKRLLETSFGKAAHQTSRASLGAGKRSVRSGGTIEKLERIETTLSELFDESREVSPALAKHVKTAANALQRARSLVGAKHENTEESRRPAGSAGAKRAPITPKPEGAAAKPVSSDARTSKKGIYRARRKSWPKR